MFKAAAIFKALTMPSVARSFGLASAKQSEKSFRRCFASCQKVQTVREELGQTFDNNYEQIKTTLQGKSFLVSAFYLEKLGELRKGEPELFETIFKNLLHEEVEYLELSALLQALKGITSEFVFEQLSDFQIGAVLQKIYVMMVDYQHLYKEDQKKTINRALNVWNESERGKLKFNLLEEQVSTTEQALSSLDLNNKLKDLQDRLVIREFDVENSKIVLELPQLDKTIVLSGIELQPSNSLETILDYISNKKLQCLVIEDSPVADSRNLGPINPKNLVENIMQIRKFTSVYSWLEDDLLQDYADPFTKDKEIFEYDKEYDIIRNKVHSSSLSIPFELGTVVYRYLKQASKHKLKPKVLLADLTTNEQIGYYSREKSLEDLRSLIPLCSNTILLDKYSLAVDSCEKGCFYCKEREDQPLPKDNQVLLGGGRELPFTKRVDILALSLLRAATETPENNKDEILAVYGGFNIVPILRRLIDIVENVPDLRAWKFDRKGYLSDLFETGDWNESKERNNELIEKMAILDVIKEDISNDIFQNADISNMTEDIENYVKFLEKYNELISYEHLAAQNQNSITYSSQFCAVENMIFGDPANQLQDNAQEQQKVASQKPARFDLSSDSDNEKLSLKGDSGRKLRKRK